MTTSAEALAVLADPVDGSDLIEDREAGILRSLGGRCYSVDPQGFVRLVSTEAEIVDPAMNTVVDDPEMLYAREQFLASGFFAPFVEAVTALTHEAIADSQRCATPPVIVDIGAGTGYYLAHSLDDVDGAIGIGLDLSEAAASHLAHCHPRATAVVADSRRRLPLKEASIDVATVVFSPCSPKEIARALRPGGRLVAMVASPGHLDELRRPMGISPVAAGAERAFIAEAEASGLRVLEEPEDIGFNMHLDAAALKEQVLMSPSARTIAPEIVAERMASLPHTLQVTARAALITFGLV